MVVAELFLNRLSEKHGEHPVLTDGGRTWHHRPIRFLKLRHHIYSPYGKSVIEKAMQYIKIERKSLMTIFHAKKKNCKLKHVNNWLNLIRGFNNKELIH